MRDRFVDLLNILFMKKFWLLIGLLDAMSVHGQLVQNFILEGTVWLEKKEPAVYATVALMNLRDSNLAKSAITTEQGTYEMVGLAPGTYYLVVQLLGYESHISQPIEILSTNKSYTVDPIHLSPLSKELEEVQVVAKIPFIERKLDRTIVNVENSITAAGSTVLNILERSPGVIVNEDSGLQMRGKQGVILMIDGKPSPLAGQDLMQYLKSVPATAIDKVELITNPSSKYDAAGNAGIINIRFKKDNRQGWNGSFSLNAGHGRYIKPSASTQFNFREKKWNLFGNYSIAAPKNFTRFYIHRNFFDEKGDLATVFDQTSFIPQPLRSQNLKLGADYFISQKTTIGFMLNGNLFNQARDGITDSRITNPLGELLYTTRTENQLQGKNTNAFANLNFRRLLDSTGRELTADLDLGRYQNSNLQDFTNQYYDARQNPSQRDLLNTDQQGMIEVQSFKMDYVHPWGANAKWEAGLKSSLVMTDSDIKFFDIRDQQKELDRTRSNHFLYRENINALYSNVSRSFAHFDIQLGLRMEHTHTQGNQLTTGEAFERNYVQLFPTLFLNKTLSAAHTISFSYSRRIDRPSYRQLNPFQLFVDPYTYVVGDPSLRPVSSHIVEINHTFLGKYITTASYTRSRATITDVFRQDDQTKISYQIPANIQDFENYNLGISIPWEIKKWFTGNLSSSVYYNRYQSPLQGGLLNNDFTALDLNLTSTAILGKKGWTAECHGFYQSKNAWGLFLIDDLAQVTIGLAKTSKDRKSTFKFSVSDLFTTNHIAVIVNYQNMDFHTNRTWDSRVASLSWTHRFGKNTVPRARQRNTGVEDERRRANG
jgi:iron complex outermembrane recepter protein